MTTPMKHILDMVGPQQYEGRNLNRPHTAAVELIEGKYYGQVRHGTASSTTLGHAFDNEEDAVAHAQIMADAMNAQDEHVDAKAVKETAEGEAQ